MRFFVLGLFGNLMVAPANADGFDAMKLVEQGEVYVVALRETYLDAGHRAASSGSVRAAQFFEDRAAEIERGGELFPAHPTVYPCPNAKMAERLENAYEETFAVTTSEAADVEPYLVAAVQAAYEEWLVTASGDADSAKSEDLENTFDERLEALTRPQIFSHMNPSPGARPATISSFRLIGSPSG